MEIRSAGEAQRITAPERETAGYFGPHPLVAADWEQPDRWQGVPQVFSVTMNPRTSIRPHFHPVDQFQVFVEGEGMIGTEPLQPLTVHYADHHTTYGPLIAGDVALRYFVVRLRIDHGAFYMPESRNKRAPSTGRRRVLAESDRSAEAAAGQAGFAEPDGLAAFIHRAETSDTDQPNDAQTHRFFIVSGGEVEIAGERVGADGVVYLPQGEPTPAWVARDANTALVELRLPAA